MLLRREICNSHIQSSSEIPPYELVIEILMRLPAKSLMRFKSVSKLWLSLICSQYFTNRFLKVSSTPPRIFMWLGFDESPLKNVLLSSSPSDGTTMSSFVVDQYLTIPAMEDYSFSQVSRGLMCFVNCSSAKIYNVSTRQLFVLPDIDGSDMVAKNHDKNQKFMYHIGHDPVGDQYKVLCTVSTEGRKRMYKITGHWVLLLGGGGDGTWRKISSQCPPHSPSTRRLMTINGRMHYLAWDRLLNPVLVSFDIRSEEIIIFQEPEKNAFWPHFAHLTEYGGRVAILHHNRFKEEGVVALWVMDDVEKNMWSMKTFELHPSQMHLLDRISFVRVQGTTRDGEVIFIFVPDNSYRIFKGNSIFQPQNNFLFHIFLYDLQNNHVRRVEIKETTNRYPITMWDVIGLDDVENLMYL